ncbi:Serine/arginine repetitive matrix protein 2 [Pseudocyphellaria aurata]|nr:Serine/arginine repetitive matrix protein 2 [Pseudocyphellaria aurata]
MDDFAELALEGASTGIENYEKVYDSLRDKAQKMPNPIKKYWNGQNDRDQYKDDDQSYDSYDDYHSPRHGQTDRSRVHRHRQSRGGNVYIEESYERRSGRAKSTGRDGLGGGRGTDRDGRSKSRRKIYYSDSESSPSPPRRRRKSLGEQALAALGIGGGVAAIEQDLDKHRDGRDRSHHRRHRRESDRDYDRDRRQERLKYDEPPRRAETFSEHTQQQRMPAGYLGSNVSERDLRVATRSGNTAQSTVSTRVTRDNARGSSKRSSSSSSSSSSSVCSSSEDERRIKKMKGKEYLTAGLAAVATIHAAAGLYSSMEARDKRHEEVMKGEMTAEDARRKRNKARLQDAAAIGIAALGIKGAYSEWQEVQESRHEVVEQKSEREKRHEKRLKKAEKAARRMREERRREGRYDDRDRYRNERDGRDGYRSA